MSWLNERGIFPVGRRRMTSSICSVLGGPWTRGMACVSGGFLMPLNRFNDLRSSRSPDHNRPNQSAIDEAAWEGMPVNLSTCSSVPGSGRKESMLQPKSFARVRCQSCSPASSREVIPPSPMTHSCSFLTPASKSAMFRRDLVHFEGTG